MSRVDITVGLSVSLSGRFRLLRAALRGFLLWQSYINAQGGIAVQNGEKKPVRLISYDDRSQISCARSNVTRLLREDQIDIALRAVLQQLDDGGGGHCGRIQESSLEPWRFFRGDLQPS